MVASGSRGCGSGLRGAMSRNAMTSVVLGDPRRRDLAARRSGRTGSPGSAAMRSAGIAAARWRCGGRDDVDGCGRRRARARPGRRARAGTRPIDVLEIVPAAIARVDGDERVVRRVADPAAVVQARLEQDVGRPADVAPRPSAARASAATARSSAARRFFVALVDLARPSGSPACPGAGVAEDVETGEVDRPDERDRPAQAASSSVGKPTITSRVDRDPGDCAADRARRSRRSRPSGSAGPSAGGRRRRPTGAAGGGAASSAARRRTRPGAARRRRAAARSTRAGSARPPSRRGSAGRARPASAPIGCGSRGSRAPTSRRRTSRR